VAFLSFPSHLDAFISSEAEWQLAREKIFNGRSGLCLKYFLVLFYATPLNPICIWSVGV